jgi:hypothetical protein
VIRHHTGKPTRRKARRFPWLQAMMAELDRPPVHVKCPDCDTYTIVKVGARPVQPACFCECHRAPALARKEGR